VEGKCNHPLTQPRIFNALASVYYYLNSSVFSLFIYHMFIVIFLSFNSSSFSLCIFHYAFIHRESIIYLSLTVYHFFKLNFFF